jgi:hypothetical protein
MEHKTADAPTGGMSHYAMEAPPMAIPRRGPPDGPGRLRTGSRRSRRYPSSKVVMP